MGKDPKGGGEATRQQRRATGPPVHMRLARQAGSATSEQSPHDLTSRKLPRLGPFGPCLWQTYEGKPWRASAGRFWAFLAIPWLRPLENTSHHYPFGLTQKRCVWAAVTARRANIPGANLEGIGRAILGLCWPFPGCGSCAWYNQATRPPDRGPLSATKTRCHVAGSIVCEGPRQAQPHAPQTVRQ